MEQIAASIRHNWFRLRPPGEERHWTFLADLRAAGDATVTQVASAYSAALAQPPGAETRAVDILELARFVHALCLSEYAMDDVLLLPPDTRPHRLQILAADVGWPVDKLHAADRWWRASGRRMVFGGGP